jgi:hypothetical protein
VLLRFLPSLTDFAFLLPAVCLFVVLKGTATLLGDAGTGLHIRTGEWIWAHRQVPWRDPFSFTMPGRPWFAWEWGWDVLISAIHHHWSLAGVVWVHIALLGVIAVVLFRQVRRRAGNDVFAFALTVLALEVSSLHWLARPHLVSWLFVLATIGIIGAWERGNRWVLWSIPPLVALWTNLHGSFFIAPLTLGLYAAGYLIRELLADDKIPLLRRLKTAGECFACAVACLAASLLNPYGLELHRHVLSYLRDAKQLDVINEFQSLDFHHPPALYFEILLLLGVLAALSSIRRNRWGEALVIVVWAHFALHASRNIPIYAFFVAGPIASLLRQAPAELLDAPFAPWWRSLVRRVFSFGSDFHDLERVERIPILPVLAMAAIGLLLRSSAPLPKFRPEFSRTVFPAAAIAVFDRHPVHRILTGDQWGDYLVYRRYPEKVFIDDRTDFYGAAFDREWVTLLNGRYDWREMFRRFHFDAVLLKTGDPLASVLKESGEWTPVYDDGMAIIFLPGPKNF